MRDLLDHPIWVFLVTFVTLSIASVAGSWLRRRHLAAFEEAKEDFDIISAATLTLLGLIIGFSFSMAAARYDQRKVLEEAEANAIGTEYVRADLLPAPDAANVRKLLVAYLDQRILFYSPDGVHPAELDRRTGQLQTALWAAARAPAASQPTPIVALAVAGMNDVLNAQGYAQAAAWNRIPTAAWCLMGIIAFVCSLLVGYGSKARKFLGRLTFILPLIVAVSFLLIADIDAPRHGLIRVSPQNLRSLAQSIGSGA